MDKNCVFVLGADGYIGNALVQRLLVEGYKVVAVDDFRKRDEVKEMESFSALPVKEMGEKILVFQELGEFHFLAASLDDEMDIEYIEGLFEEFKPGTVVNLAQNPSGPYSLISREHAVKVSQGNIIGNINILYLIKEHVPETHLINIGSMGEYNHATGLPIPEGKFDMSYSNGVIKGAIFPREPGSYYHASKVATTYYIDCACRWWGLNATDIMQGVVFGNWTPEIEKTRINSPLHSDEAFGTVVNRFVVQTLIGHPMTVYGSGEHSRGFLSLNDSIQCLMLAIKNPANGYRTWNQLDAPLTMNQVALAVGQAADYVGLKWDIKNIPTPRVEKTTWFPYNPIADKIRKLGYKTTRSVYADAIWIMQRLEYNDNLYPLENVVIPKIKWQ